MNKLKLVCKNDIPYEKLITSVRSGFPESKMKTEPDLRPFWEVRNRLPCSNDLVWLDNRIVIHSVHPLFIKHVTSQNHPQQPKLPKMNKRHPLSKLTPNKKHQ